MNDTQLERVISHLRERTGLPILRNDQYGYCQLALRHGDGLKTIATTLGSSQRELYEKIQFCLEIFELVEEKEEIEA